MGFGNQAKAIIMMGLEKLDFFFLAIRLGETAGWMLSKLPGNFDRLKLPPTQTRTTDLTNCQRAILE
ncbi:hypothetical protein [Phormidium sp. CCY1219]|uniref:hypothetical protein n=1 Tax=Phormidium sp. CCY1219 TaxID=2886104 RepID=UPI002D1ECA86|nr:hypothetical protein [Phormidium sp. CCY1219]MEB3831481.1 hypothetical protein [Phormidium sp. CCY1219]